MSLRSVIWGGLAFIAMAVSLWAARPTAQGHFDNLVIDRRDQESIHPVVVDSGFHLRQKIDTQNPHFRRPSKPQDQLCLALRIEYDRKRWTTEGTVLVRLSTEDAQWETSIRSSEITTYFQTFCLPGSRPEAIADKETWVDISVVEPDLKRVALFAMGPATAGKEPAILNGTVSQLSLPYRVVVRPKPHDRDLIKYIGIYLFGCLLLIAALKPLLGGQPRSQTASPPIH